MTQQSLIKNSISGKRTISLAAITATKMVQYTSNHMKLVSLLKTTGFLTSITVLNNDEINIELQLDYSENKEYFVPSKSSIALTEVHYEGFNIVNLDDAIDSTAGRITVIAGYEMPLSKEK